MGVTLRVRDDHQLLGSSNSSRSLSDGRLTIGRGPENDWVLPDPERVISKQHCLIEAHDGVYSLTDTSSNGVFVNASDKPVGRGNKVVLTDGDHFRISHFRIDVSLDEAAKTQPAEMIGEDDPFGESGFGEDAGDKALADIFGDSTAGAEDSSSGTDFGGFDEPFSGSVSEFGTAEDLSDESDSLSPGHEYFNPPEPVPEPLESLEIPDDWDSEWTSEPAAGSAGEAASPVPQTPAADPFALEEAAPAPAATRTAEAARPAAPAAAPTIPATPAPPAAPETPPAPGSQMFGGGEAKIAGRNLMQAFLEGAALGDLKIPDEKAEETMRLLGALFRETVRGLREVLAARSSIKSEFRLTQTMIQPVENNPLKFSLGDDDAMAALLTKTGQGYLPPQRAVNEAFEDVKAHQVAVMVGMQAALTGLLARFDPRALENRIDHESSAVGGLLRGKKSKYWDAFATLYATIAAEAEDDFQNVFGREFGKAYETQTRKQTRRS